MSRYDCDRHQKANLFTIQRANTVSNWYVQSLVVVVVVVVVVEVVVVVPVVIEAKFMNKVDPELPSPAWYTN